MFTAAELGSSQACVSTSLDRTVRMGTCQHGARDRRDLRPHKGHHGAQVCKHLGAQDHPAAGTLSQSCSSAHPEQTKHRGYVVWW